MSGPQRDENGRLIQFRGPDFSPDCRKCPCATPSGKPSRPIKAHGATGGLALVGEGPGAEEVYQGHPFVGPSGKLVNKMLKAGGIDRALLWVTNALLCPRPPGEAALAQAVACCRPRLQQELASVEPTAVLALGGTAMQSLQLPVSRVSEGRGTVQHTPVVPDVPVFSTLHPAALLRGGAGDVSGGSNKQNLDTQALFFQADIEKAYKVASGQIAPYWSDDIEAFVPQPSTAESAPEQPPAADPPQEPFDPIAMAVAEKWPTAFRDYFAANPDVWAEFCEVAVKGAKVSASMDMIWGVLGFNMAEKDKTVPGEYKPYYVRLWKARQERDSR